jgi:prolipoprotein diacylglyceryltransferase
MYFAGRIGVEFVKEYQVLGGGLTMGQWLSIPGVVAGIAILVHAMRRRPEWKVKVKGGCRDRW